MSRYAEPTSYPSCVSGDLGTESVPMSLKVSNQVSCIHETVSHVLSMHVSRDTGTGISTVREGEGVLSRRQSIGMVRPILGTQGHFLSPCPWLSLGSRLLEVYS